MTADDLTRLRAITEAATPGPWYRNSGLIWGHDSAVVTDTRNLNHDDAVHIATFDPPTVAALIDRVERAERERDRLDGELSLARGTFELMRDELAALRAAVAGLADEWECSDPDGRYGYSATVHREACMWCRGADELRALLTEGADDGQ